MGFVRYLPSHPHEGGIGAPDGEDARVILREVPEAMADTHRYALNIAA
jgi:hypothetical protein